MQWCVQVFILRCTVYSGSMQCFAYLLGSERNEMEQQQSIEYVPLAPSLMEDSTSTRNTTELILPPSVSWLHRSDIAPVVIVLPHILEKKLNYLQSIFHPFSLTTCTMSNYDDDRDIGFNTVQLHHGQVMDSDHRARAPPIYASTSFGFKNAEHGANLFALKELGPIYTRIMNPTSHTLEYRIAKLEGSTCQLDGAHPSALACASGQGAQFTAIFSICQAGDWVIAAGDLYGGTYAAFRHTFPSMGVNVKFINGQNLDELKAAFEELGDKAKVCYFETIGNPSFNVPDFDGISTICKENNCPFVVDNTFGMCGYTCRPFKYGVNIITASCTKWIGGHGNTIGGIIVDNGTFDWSVKAKDGSSKFPLLNDDCAAYHGMNFNGVFGPTGPFGCNMAFIFRARVCTLRDTGACQNPFGSFQLLVGLETLSLRGKAHSENANALAAWLKGNENVAWVSHLSLPEHKSHNNAKKYFREGCFGAVLSFGVKGGFEAAKKFIDGVKLASHLANVGDAKTLVIHPASTTHQQLSAEEQAAAGVKSDMIRVSVGYEDLKDIQADFSQAFAAAAN